MPVECSQPREPLVSSPRLITSRFLNHAQKVQHSLKREVCEREARYRPTTEVADMDQKQLQRVRSGNSNAPRPALI
jgi:hypothetical protein